VAGTAEFERELFVFQEIATVWELMRNHKDIFAAELFGHF
jgi:hypothetical protein